MNHLPYLQLSVAEDERENEVITLHRPETQHAAAFGKVAIFHANLDYALRLMVKSLCNLELKEALRATSRQGSHALRERVRKLAQQRFGEGEALVKLDAILCEAKLLTEERNDVMHSVLAKTEDGTVVWIDERPQHRPAATEDQLNTLADKIWILTHRIHDERLNGWLARALNKTEKQGL